MQLFKTLWDRKRKFYTVPVQKKGRQKTDEAMQYIVDFPYLHVCMAPSPSVHGSMYHGSLGDLQQATDRT